MSLNRSLSGFSIIPALISAIVFVWLILDKQLQAIIFMLYGLAVIVIFTYAIHLFINKNILKPIIILIPSLISIYILFWFIEKTYINPESMVLVLGAGTAFTSGSTDSVLVQALDPAGSAYNVAYFEDSYFTTSYAGGVIATAILINKSSGFPNTKMWVDFPASKFSGCTKNAVLMYKKTTIKIDLP